MADLYPNYAWIVTNILRKKCCHTKCRGNNKPTNRRTSEQRTERTRKRTKKRANETNKQINKQTTMFHSRIKTNLPLALKTLCELLHKEQLIVEGLSLSAFQLWPFLCQANSNTIRTVHFVSQFPQTPVDTLPLSDDLLVDLPTFK